jgi:hypothetical protein
MQKLKDLSAQITAALDKILPEDISCVFVLYDPKEKDVCSAANISDEGAAFLLEEAAETLRNPEETNELKIN